MSDTLARYMLKRAVMALVVLVVIMVGLAIAVHLVPGDPVRAILGPYAAQSNPELVRVVRSEMDLNAPVGQQVWHFVVRAVHGDLGHDFFSRRSVAQLVGGALVHTGILAVASLTVALMIGIPLGVYASRRPNSVADRVIRLVSVLLITIPPYILGLFLVIIFAVTLRVLPATGSGELNRPVDYGRHLVLPALALAAWWIGYLCRLVRVSMLEVVGANYIRVARAFGLSERLIFYKYALKSAILPTVALLGIGLGSLMGGAIVVEVIFARPGLGTLLVNAINDRNYPIVRGAVLVVASLFITANLMADLSYRLLDPRTRDDPGSV